MRRVTPRIQRRLTVVRLVASGLALVVAAAACGIASADPNAGDGAPSDTVGGIGRLPVTIPSVTFSEEITEKIDITLPAIEGEEIGSVAGGNRLLMVGDSLFAGLARRFSNLACDRLEPLGWQVLVEAESGRFIDFGRQVLNRRLDEGWDAVALMFGTNYLHDKTKFSETLGSMLADLGDVPVVLMTTTVFREQQREVNEVITGFANLLPNVSLVDWATISTTPGVLSPDRIHPTNEGRAVMIAAIAQVLGEAPEGPGGCLNPQFTDDSAVSRGTTGASATTVATSPSGGGDSSVGQGSTTSKPPSSSSTTSSSTSSSSTSAPSPSTDPPSTSPPGTVLPTVPPVTPTSPPDTSPPDN